jgi:hypothetical protein
MQDYKVGRISGLRSIPKIILQTFALPALSLDAGCGERVSPVEDSLIPL